MADIDEGREAALEVARRLNEQAMKSASSPDVGQVAEPIAAPDVPTDYVRAPAGNGYSPAQRNKP